MKGQPIAALGGLLLGIWLAAGCGADGFTGGEVVFGFGDSGHRLRVWTTSAAFFRQARDRLGRPQVDFPVFDLVDGVGCDRQWSWTVDPATPTFAEASTEVCDGLPSDVEADKAYWLSTVRRFCPWSARVLEVREPVASPEACR